MKGQIWVFIWAVFPIHLITDHDVFVSFLELIVFCASLNVFCNIFIFLPQFSTKAPSFSAHFWYSWHDINVLFVVVVVYFILLTCWVFLSNIWMWSHWFVSKEVFRLTQRFCRILMSFTKLWQKNKCGVRTLNWLLHKKFQDNLLSVPDEGLMLETLQ